MIRYLKEEKMILAATEHIEPWAWPVMLLAGILAGCGVVLMTKRYGKWGFAEGVLALLGICYWIGHKTGIF
jgi:hypothetical protein